MTPREEKTSRWRGIWDIVRWRAIWIWSGTQPLVKELVLARDTVASVGDVGGAPAGTAATLAGTVAGAVAGGSGRVLYNALSVVNTLTVHTCCKRYSTADSPSA